MSHQLISSVNCKIVDRSAFIAQLVEQMTLNHRVRGSNPRGRTTFSINDLQLIFTPLKLTVFSSHGLSMVLCLQAFLSICSIFLLQNLRFYD